MGKSEDLRDFGIGQIDMTRHLGISEMDKPQTGDRVLGIQDLSVHKGD